jgi:hypothetical protein
MTEQTTRSRTRKYLRPHCLLQSVCAFVSVVNAGDNGDPIW